MIGHRNLIRAIFATWLALASGGLLDQSEARAGSLTRPSTQPDDGCGGLCNPKLWGENPQGSGGSGAGASRAPGDYGNMNETVPGTGGLTRQKFYDDGTYSAKSPSGIDNDPENIPNQGGTNIDRQMPNYDGLPKSPAERQASNDSGGDDDGKGKKGASEDKFSNQDREKSGDTAVASAAADSGAETSGSAAVSNDRVAQNYGGGGGGGASAGGGSSGGGNGSGGGGGATHAAATAGNVLNVADPRASGGNGAVGSATGGASSGNGASGAPERTLEQMQRDAAHISHVAQRAQENRAQVNLVGAAQALMRAAQHQGNIAKFSSQAAGDQGKQQALGQAIGEQTKAANGMLMNAAQHLVSAVQYFQRAKSNGHTALAAERNAAALSAETGTPSGRHAPVLAVGSMGATGSSHPSGASRDNTLDFSGGAGSGGGSATATIAAATAGSTRGAAPSAATAPAAAMAPLAPIAPVQGARAEPAFDPSLSY